MLAQSLKSSASRLTRLQVVSRPLLARSFIVPTAIRQSPDVVQDLYLKELKSYKIPPVKDSDSQGQVKVWSEPKARDPPQLMTQAEQELSAYQTQAVEVEGGASATAEGGEESSKKDDDWFEEDVVFEEEKSHH